MQGRERFCRSGWKLGPAVEDAAGHVTERSLDGDKIGTGERVQRRSPPMDCFETEGREIWFRYPPRLYFWSCLMEDCVVLLVYKRCVRLVDDFG